MDATKLIAWLPFNESVTQDFCGNTWTANGTPTISDGRLSLNGSSYLQRAEKFEFTGQPFTVSCKFSCMSNTTGGSVCLWQMHIGDSNRIQISISTSGKFELWKDSDSTINIISAASVLDGQIHHAECDFDGATWYLFLDGNLIGTKAHTCSARNYTLYVGTNYQKGRKFTGTIDEFQIYDGIALHTENFTPPTDDDYDDLEMAITGLDYVTRTVVFDVERKVKNATKLNEMATALKVYLPFDESAVEDWCGNAWTAYGSPTIANGAVHLPSGAYLTANNIIDLNSDKWTFSCRCYCVSRSGENGFFGLGEGPKRRGIVAGDDGIFVAAPGGGSWQAKTSTRFFSELNQWVHLEVDKDGTSLKFFCDGNLVWSTTINGLDDTGNFVLGGNSYGYTNDLYFDEVLFFEGIALHNENFTPPSDEYYADLKNALEDSATFVYTVDVETVIRNAPRADVDGGIGFTGGNNSYATIPKEIFTGGSEFTIEIEFSSTATRDNSYFVMQPIIIGRDNDFNRDSGVNLRLRGGNLVFWEINADTDENYINTGKFVADGNPHKVAVVSNEDGSLDIYCDGELISHTENFNAVFTSSQWSFGTTAFAGNGNSVSNDNNMTLYESRFWSKSLTAEELFADITGDEENLEAWYIPTEKGLLDYSSNMRTATITGTTTYMELETVFVDVEYESSNDALAWRYEDCAVYFGTGAPINFHVPKAYELWIRFDVYFDGEARWYAYDDGIYGMTGITALTTLELDYLSAGATIKTLPDVCKSKQTQTFLLHMISGATDGVIEVWAGLEQLESFYGNVNNGRPFVDFVLRSDDSGTSFTELIISNTRLEPDEKPANVVRATKTSQLNTCNTKTGVIWLEPGGDYPFPYITYTIREVIRQTVVKSMDIGEGEFKPVKSLWAKFDIFNDGVNRWWFYNLNELLGRSGVCALTNGDINFVANEFEVQQEENLCAVGQWQTFIIHMESDEVAGLIEVITDNATYSYTGNVNGGEEFTDVYLLSEGDKVVFDNFIVSTAPLDFDTTKKMSTPEKTSTLAFVVRRFGEDVAVPILNAVAIRWLGCDWYNSLVLPDNANASTLPVRCGGVDYVLSVPT